MSYRGMPRPERTSLPGSAVADSDHEVHHRGMGLCVLIPAFRAVAVCGIAMGSQHLQRERVHAALGLTARRVCPEAALTILAQDAFSQDRPGRVAGAEEEHVVGSLTHGRPHLAA